MLLKRFFISVVLFAFLLPFLGAVGHAYELIDWNGYGYFFKVSTALFLSLWGVVLCHTRLVLNARAPRVARIGSAVIAALAILAPFGTLPFCMCLHMFCVLGLLVIGALMRNTHLLPRWYYCLHFALSFIIVFCYVLIFTAHL